MPYCGLGGSSRWVLNVLTKVDTWWIKVESLKLKGVKVEPLKLKLSADQIWKVSYSTIVTTSLRETYTLCVHLGVFSLVCAKLGRCKTCEANSMLKADPWDLCKTSCGWGRPVRSDFCTVLKPACGLWPTVTQEALQSTSVLVPLALHLHRRYLVAPH